VSDLASCTARPRKTTKLVLGFSHQKRVVSQPRPIVKG